MRRIIFDADFERPTILRFERRFFGVCFALKWFWLATRRLTFPFEEILNRLVNAFLVFPFLAIVLFIYLNLYAPHALFWLLSNVVLLMDIRQKGFDPIPCHSLLRFLSST